MIVIGSEAVDASSSAYLLASVNYKPRCGAWKAVVTERFVGGGESQKDKKKADKTGIRTQAPFETANRC